MLSKAVRRGAVGNIAGVVALIVVVVPEEHLDLLVVLLPIFPEHFDDFGLD